MTADNIAISPASAEAAKAWPFAEARALQARLAKMPNDDASRPVLFETGYGPSGLPVKTSKARRTMLVRTTSAKVPICGRPEGPYPVSNNTG